MRYLVLFLSCALALSCSSDDDNTGFSEEIIPTGSITIQYNGKTVEFKNPELMFGGADSEFDLSVRGYVTFDDSHHLKNFISLPFNNVDGQYQLAQIDLNDNRWASSTHLETDHYYVFLTGVLADTDFQHESTLTAENHLTGSFSGTLQPGGMEPDGTPAIHIDGSFDLDLNATN